MALRGTQTISEDTFPNIRNFLNKFQGGAVSLLKDNSSGVAKIKLSHSEKRNAMSGVMMVNLRDCVEELENWKEGKAVILYGEGGNFCSGADLNFAKASGTAEEGMKMSMWMQDCLKRLHKLPLISVCLIEGPSIGGGAEMPVFCDYIIAADNVKFGFVHGRMGITAAWGGGTRLAQKIGQTRALDLMLTARVLSAKECVEVGLAEVIVPANGALYKVEEWLTPRIRHHHTVTRAMKDIILNTYSHTYEEALHLEKFLFAPLWGAEANREALAKNIKHVEKSHSHL